MSVRAVLHHRPGQPTVLARIDAMFRRPGSSQLTFRVTRAGRRVLARSRSTVVTYEAVVARAHPLGVPAGHPVHLVARVRVRGR